MTGNEIACVVVDVAIEVHRGLGGPVRLESESGKKRQPVFAAQALTPLRLMDLRLALVVDFGRRLVRDGGHRVFNGL